MRHIASVAVEGRALPWTAPVVARQVRRDRTSTARTFTPGDSPKWKARVQKAMKDVMAETRRKLVEDGPVFVRMEFTWGTEDRAKWGTPAYVPSSRSLRQQMADSKGRGDLCNCYKLVEDAGKRVIYADDRLVAGLMAWAYWGEKDAVAVHVFALEPGDCAKVPTDGGHGARRAAAGADGAAGR